MAKLSRTRSVMRSPLGMTKREPTQLLSILQRLKSGITFSCAAAEYINETDQHRPRILANASDVGNNRYRPAVYPTVRDEGSLPTSPKDDHGLRGQTQTRCRATRVPQARVTDGQPGLLLTTAGRRLAPGPGPHRGVPELWTRGSIPVTRSMQDLSGMVRPD